MSTSTPDPHDGNDSGDDTDLDAEEYGGLSVEDDLEGTVMPADVAGTDESAED